MDPSKQCEITDYSADDEHGTSDRADEEHTTENNGGNQSPHEQTTDNVQCMSVREDQHITEQDEDNDKHSMSDTTENNRCNKTPPQGEDQQGDDDFKTKELTERNPATEDKDNKSDVRTYRQHNIKFSSDRESKKTLREKDEHTEEHTTLCAELQSVNLEDKNTESTSCEDEPKEVKGEQFCEWDEVAEIPTAHFSLLINLLFPKHVASWKLSKTQQSIDEINKKRRADFGMNTVDNCVPVGSVAECYQMPNIISKTGIISAQNLSDTDVLLVWDTSAIRELDTSANPKQKLVLETESSHYGYTRVLINDPTTVLRDVDPNFAIKLNDKYYLSAKKQRENTAISATSEAMVSKIPIVVDQSGPATALEDITQRTLKFFKENKKVQDRQELVPAIKCVWPSQASNWTTRVCNNKWISPQLAESVVGNGCHVVPVPHKLSRYQDVEWRISFATSEVQLAREIITTDQRQCYLYFKLLGNIVLKKHKLISSYHMKTTFLYACEKLPVKMWTENAGGCVLYMLDQLLMYVRNRWLPSFFIPENNLMDHLTELEFETLESLIQATRVDPIGPMLDFTDNHVISNQGVTTPFRQTISALLNDFKVFRVHRSIQSSLPNFVVAVNGIVTSILLDNKCAEAVAYLFDSFSFLQMYTKDTKIDNYMYLSFVNWKLIIQLVQIFENILTYCDEYPDLLSLRGYLACLYHAASFNFVPGTAGHMKALNKSESLMKSILKEELDVAPTTIDLALLLITQGKIQEAVQLLTKLLEQPIVDSQQTNKYNSVTSITLNESLKMEVQEMLKTSIVVTFPSLSLAHYLRLIAIQHQENLENQKDTRNAIETFDAHCHARRDKWSFYLLGLALMDIELWDQATTAFEEALKLDSSHFLSRMKLVISKVNMLISQENIKASLHILKEFSQLYYSNIPLSRTVDKVALHLKYPSYSTKLYEELLSNVPESPSCRSNMACMFYAEAQLHSPETDEHMTAIVQADTLFYTCSVLDSSGCQSAGTIDYVSYLCSQQRWQDAKDLCENFLYRDEKAPCSNSYGRMEFNCLDNNLKKEVRIHGNIAADSVTFAYYFLVKSFLVFRKDDISRVMSEFKLDCVSRKNHVAYSLLGYCNIMLENWGEAENCFCKAVELKWDYAVAKQNIALSREKMIWKRDLRKNYVPLCIIPDLLGDFNMDFDKISEM